MGAAWYEIVVEGHLDRTHWSRWFGGMQLSTTAEGTTVLSGPVTDQAALHGLLVQIRDLGVALVSVQRVGGSDASEETRA
jgi:hypothetical protein